jgi:hypothetical protein
VQSFMACQYQWVSVKISCLIITVLKLIN